MTEESLKEEEKEREKILYPKYIPENYELEKRKGKERTDSNRSFPLPLLSFHPEETIFALGQGKGGEERMEETRS